MLLVFIVRKLLIVQHCMKWLVNRFFDQPFQLLDVSHSSCNVGTHALLAMNIVTVGRHTTVEPLYYGHLGSVLIIKVSWFSRSVYMIKHHLGP